MKVFGKIRSDVKIIFKTKVLMLFLKPKDASFQKETTLF